MKKNNKDKTINIYFVRHALPNFDNHDDLTRELTEKGLRDRSLVTEYLWDKDITRIFSSPFKRTVDTVRDFADKKGLNIEIIDDFRKRKIGDVWVESFKAYASKQWQNFDYKLESGESLRETQERNVLALKKVLEDNEGESIVIGTHSTALSTIINYYEDSFCKEGFFEIIDMMPLIVKFTFIHRNIIEIEKVDVFTHRCEFIRNFEKNEQLVSR